MTNDQYDQLLRICKRPGMYVGVADYDQVCAYLDGLHAATGCLTGFGEWLIVRVGAGNNLMWQGLVSIVLSDESVAKDDQVAGLSELIGEFHQFMRPTGGGTNGLMRVYVRYHEWLLSQNWYRPERADYVPPHAG
jgi:hypothetical protein